MEKPSAHHKTTTGIVENVAMNGHEQNSGLFQFVVVDGGKSEAFGVWYLNDHEIFFRLLRTALEAMWARGKVEVVSVPTDNLWRAISIRRPD